MFNIEQKMKEFSNKSYDERLRISTNIITNLKDRGNAQAQEIFDIMSDLDEVPDDLLNAIYKDYSKSVERIKQERIQWDLHNFEKARNHIKNMREVEARERAEENPDWLLEWL